MSSAYANTDARPRARFALKRGSRTLARATEPGGAALRMARLVETSDASR